MGPRILSLLVDCKTVQIRLRVGRPYFRDLAHAVVAVQASDGFLLRPVRPFCYCPRRSKLLYMPLAIGFARRDAVTDRVESIGLARPRGETRHQRSTNQTAPGSCRHE
jgi:hypothetical protein